MVKGFIPYSLGMVAKDSVPGSKYVEVYPVELYPAVDGDINTVTSKQDTTANIESGYVTTSVDKTYTIKAKWLAIGESNRLTSPDVCMGETVQIYKFGDSDRYYWLPVYSELDLRKKESVIKLYSNTDNIEKRPDDSYYYTIVDTIKKFLRIHTSKSDGESFGYDIDINTAKSIITIEDTGGNSIVLDSGKAELNIITNKKINIKTETILVEAKDITNKIANKLDIQLKHLSISNGSNELISVLSELVDKMMQEKHIGNLGIPTTLSPDSMSAYAGIKAKLDSFK
jgi:hypothetical protein